MRFLLLLAALAAAPALAQAPADTLDLAPGDGTLVTDWIAPGTRDFTIRVVQPMTQNVGTTSETVTVDGGVVTRVSTVSVPMQGVEQRDSIRAEAATLAPLTHTSTGGAADASLEFMAEGVVGMITPRSGEAQTVTLLTDAPVFDSAWLVAIAQSLPLEEGLVVRVPAFTNQSPEAAIEAVLTVGAEEPFAAADGDRPAVTIEADLGPMAATYVVDAETRELLVTRFSPQPGVVIEIAPAE